MQSRVFVLWQIIQIMLVAGGTTLTISSCSSIKTAEYQTPTGPYKPASPGFRMQSGGRFKQKSPGEVPVSDNGDGSGDEQGLPKLAWSHERAEIRPKEDYNFDWPVDEARLSRGFSLSGKKAHWGIDLANQKGTPIFSSERGTVIYAGRGFKGYGKLVVIEHGSEWATLYSHLSKIEVREGDQVEQGERIGQMGRTGHATGNHLHFELRHLRQPVNPLAYLPSALP